MHIQDPKLRRVSDSFNYAMKIIDNQQKDFLASSVFETLTYGTESFGNISNGDFSRKGTCVLSKQISNPEALEFFKDTVKDIVNIDFKKSKLLTFDYTSNKGIIAIPDILALILLTEDDNLVILTTDEIQVIFLENLGYKSVANKVIDGKNYNVITINDITLPDNSLSNDIKEFTDFLSEYNNEIIKHGNFDIIERKLSRLENENKFKKLLDAGSSTLSKVYNNDKVEIGTSVFDYLQDKTSGDIISVGLVRKERSFWNAVVENNTDDVLAGTENIINEIFFRIDKTLQTGIKNIIDYFHTVNVFIEDMEEYKTKTPNIGDLYKLLPIIQEHINAGTGFHRIANKKAPVLLGLNITLPELYKILDNNKVFVNGIMDLLKDFDAQLDKILNMNKDAIKLDVDTSNMRAIEKNIESINKDMEKVTSKKILTDRKPIKELVKNMLELQKLAKDALKLGNSYKMENLENLMALNNDIVIKLDTIYEAIKDKKTAMDKHSLQAFSKYINVIAKYITAIAFLYYLYYQLLNMIVAIIKILDTIREDHSAIDFIASSIREGYKVLIGFVKDAVK